MRDWDSLGRFSQRDEMLSLVGPSVAELEPEPDSLILKSSRHSITARVRFARLREARHNHTWRGYSLEWDPARKNRR